MTTCNTPAHEQDPTEILDYTIDFSRRLADGEAIASVVAFEVVSGVGVVGTAGYAPTFDATTARGWLSDVELGADVVFRGTVETDATPPRQLSDAFTIRPTVRATG